MRILAVDTSTSAGSIAALEDKQLLGQEFTGPRQDHSSGFFEELQALLTKVHMSMAEFDVFAVCAGPGSFTALRVSLTAVKVWAEVYGKPIATVSGLEAVASQAQVSSEFVASVRDGRRGQVFGGLFRSNGGRLHRVGDEVVMRPDEFINEVLARVTAESAAPRSSNSVSFVSPEPDLIRDALSKTDLRAASVEKCSDDLAPWIGRLAFDYAQRGELVDALALDANYVRRTDAESYWKDSR